MTPHSLRKRTRRETSVTTACLLHCLHTAVQSSLPAFPIWSALLTAALCQFGCKPVQDDLFQVYPTSIAQAGEPASDGQAGADAQAVLMQANIPKGGAEAGEQTNPGLRPPPNSSVTFDWMESIPGAGACQAAMFTGRFYCMVATIIGKPDQLNGSINLVLRGSSESQTLNIDGGNISVYDESMNNVVITTVSGGLECGTQRLKAMVDPKPTEAMPVERQLSWLNPNVNPVTTGTLTGSLDPQLQEIGGDMELDFEGGTRCVGEFKIKAWAFE